MLKAWRKSCGKRYQHFKALKDQCDAFNGGEKPFVHARRAVLGFQGSLDCHNPGVRLTHSWWAVSKSSSSASLLRGCGHRCAASLQSERDGDMSTAVSTCLLWGAGALMWSRLNKVPLWGLDNWPALPHSYPILSTVCMFVHECFCRCPHKHPHVLQRVSRAAWHTGQSH